MSWWKTLRSKFTGSIEVTTSPSVDDFVSDSIRKIIDGVIYDFDTTFTCKNQVVEYISHILYSMRNDDLHCKEDLVVEKKSPPIKLKPLTSIPISIKVHSD